MGGRDVVVGASDHYGRAELVTLGLVEGAPVLLDRRRVGLIGEGLPVAPYHHEALELELGEAVELVGRVRRSVAERARAGLAGLVEAHGAGVLVLPASPYARLPGSLEAVLRSRALVHAADGMLYREGLAEAAVGLGMEVRRVARKVDPAARAAEALEVDVEEVVALVARLGKEAGPPWRQDHKRAAAAALGVLAERMRR